jgi:hypothetical protein
MWTIVALIFLIRDAMEGISVPTRSIDKYQPILQAARQLYESDTDWVTFFREIFGVDGIIRRQFSRLEDLTAFERSAEFEQIQKWLVKLREQKNATDIESEPTRVITIRMPKSMHEYLRTEAHDLRTSMNKLCISKLLQVVERDMVPRGIPDKERRSELSRETLRHQHEELRRQFSELQTKLRDYERCLSLAKSG